MLWEMKTCEKMAMTSEIESTSSHSDNCSEDQETSKGSPCNSQSPEVVTETGCDEINSKNTNEDVHSLIQKPSDVIGDDESKELLLNEEDPMVMSDEDAEEQSDASVTDGTRERSPKCNVSTVFMDKAAGDKGLKGTVEDDSENVKLLREKLTAALVNVNIKDDLVKQHSKVAEEAVAGWEKAEKDAETLKQQLDSAVESKSALEARVSHLDEALKECVRQLRLGRHEQERKINKAVAERTSELEHTKSQLQDLLVELQGLVETCRVSSPDPELLDKLEYFEIENGRLRRQIESQCEELEVRTIERDLSTKVAETASKQHLESIKKIAKLEAECRKLKSIIRKSSPSNDHGSSVVSESESNGHRMNGWGSHERTPSRSGSCASLGQLKGEKVIDKNLHSSKDINLMDDFLEMEFLAALPDTGSQVRAGCEQTSEKSVSDTENKYKAELDAMAYLNAELEKTKGRLGEEKAELEMALAQTPRLLDSSQVQMIDAQIKLEQLERDMCQANEGEQFYQTAVGNLEMEVNMMSSQIRFLRVEMNMERVLAEEKTSRLEELERELEKKEHELEMQQKIICNDDLKMTEVALAESQDCLKKSQAQLKDLEKELNDLEKELQEANEENKSLNTELDVAQAQVRTMSTRIESLNQQVREKQVSVVELSAKTEESERLNIEMESLNRRMQKEQALVAELSNQVKELERELRQNRLELDARQRAHSSFEMQIKQEDAAGKLADCQKTIASLGNQLKSLATLEDFLIDTASIPSTSRRSSVEPWKLHLNNTFSGSEASSPTRTQEGFSSYTSHNGGLPGSSAFFSSHPVSGPERVEDGFAKYFSISRN